MTEESMDIAKYIEPAKKFLSAEDVKQHPNDLFVVTEAPTIAYNDNFKKHVMSIPGNFGDKEDMVFSCSKTNAKTIADVLGDDGKKWIGKVLVFETYKTKTSEGKLVDAINVKEVRV